MPKAPWDETIVLDQSHLQEFTGGDEELEQTVLNLFCNNAPVYLLALVESSPSDWKTSAHKLKGAARSIGAWSLACEAERAEKMIVPAVNGTERNTILKELALRLETLLLRIRDVSNSM